MFGPCWNAVKVRCNIQSHLYSSGGRFSTIYLYAFPRMLLDLEYRPRPTRQKLFIRFRIWSVANSGSDAKITTIKLLLHSVSLRGDLCSLTVAFTVCCIPSNNRRQNEITELSRTLILVTAENRSERLSPSKVKLFKFPQFFTHHRKPKSRYFLSMT